MNKYLKYFETEQEYISYMQGSEVLRPNISFCEGTDDVHFNKANIEITVRNTSTAPQSGYDVGSDIVLQINVKNIGDETITNINMESQLTGDEWTINSLAPGQTQSIQTQYITVSSDIVAGEIKIDFTATGKISNNRTTSTEEIFVVDNLAQPNPQFTFYVDITSTPSNNSEYRLGDVITYSATVENVGNVVLNKVIFDNNHAFIVNIEPEYFETIQGLTYTVTEEDILQGRVSHSVIANGLFPNRNTIYTTVTEYDTLTTNDIEDPNPSLLVQAVVTSLPLNHQTYALGETILYKVTVTNDGNLTVSNIVVEAELSGDEWTINSLAPGQTYYPLTAEYVVTEADVLAGSVRFKATANGDNYSDDPTDPGDDEAESLVDEPNPHLTLYKTTTSTPANGQYYVLGETISYKITARNDGNLTLTDIVVEDEITGDEWTIESLGPGVSFEYTTDYDVTEPEALAGSVTNVVTATGDNPSDESTVVVDGFITTPAGFVST